jgi:hypothetical protein
MSEITTVKQAKAKVDHLEGTIIKHRKAMKNLKEGNVDLKKKGANVWTSIRLATGYNELKAIEGKLEQDLKEAKEKLASLESKPAPAKEPAPAPAKEPAPAPAKEPAPAPAKEPAPAPAKEPAAGGGKKSRRKKSRKSRKSKRRKRNSKKKKTYKRRR